MFSLNNIVLPNALEEMLGFLVSFGVNFGGFVVNINGDFSTLVWLIAGFILVLIFSNSIQKINNFQLNYKNASLAGLAFFLSLMSLNKISEFLYFNF
jgi:hypothetical protein